MKLWNECDLFKPYSDVGIRSIFSSTIYLMFSQHSIIIIYIHGGPECFGQTFKFCRKFNFKEKVSNKYGSKNSFLKS